jgi:hypothetical protein
MRFATKEYYRFFYPGNDNNNEINHRILRLDGGDRDWLELLGWDTENRAFLSRHTAEGVGSERTGGKALHAQKVSASFNWIYRR